MAPPTAQHRHREGPRMDVVEDRKSKRKEERLRKKQRRKKRQAVPDNKDNDEDGVAPDDDDGVAPNDDDGVAPDGVAPVVPERKAPPTAKRRRKVAPAPVAKQMNEEMAAALKRDEEEIALLEQNLGIGTPNNRRRLHKEYAKLEGFGNDFGEFLDSLDDWLTSDRAASSGLLDDDDDSEDDDLDDEQLVPMKGPADTMFSDKEEEEDDDELDDDVEIDAEDGEEDDDDDEDAEERNVQSDDDKDNDDKDENLNKSHKNESSSSSSSSLGATAGKTTRGIYGDNQVESQAGTYTPPHLRQTEKTTPALQLTATLNGALNRLSDQTLESVVSSLVALYRHGSSQEVNDAVWQALCHACVTEHSLVTNLIPLHVACVAGVHFLARDTALCGAHLVEQVVTQLWQHVGTPTTKTPDKPQEEEDAVHQTTTTSSSSSTTDAEPMVENKVPCNLTLILCHLYNFGIVHCTLLFDVMQHLLQQTTERNLELLLLILNHCGSQLRLEDPATLHQVMQDCAGIATSSSSSSRVAYLKTAIANLQTKPKKKRQMSPEDACILHYRKAIGRIKTASGGRLAQGSLRISLADILNIETKGRWWKVGAAWKDNLFQGNHDKQTTTAPAKSSHNNNDNGVLARAATQLRMNTEVKRAIFYIIMGSTDCHDALEKLVRGGLVEKRNERHVMRVLVECCGHEAAYNPYYAHLASRLCQHQPHSARFTLQLVWKDFVSSWHDQDVEARRVANLAKLLAHLTVAQHLSLRRLLLPVLHDLTMPPDDEQNAPQVFFLVFFTHLLQQVKTADAAFHLFRHAAAAATEKTTTTTTTEESLEHDHEQALGQGLILYLTGPHMKSNPHNKKNTPFRANLEAAIQGCTNANQDF